MQPNAQLAVVCDPFWSQKTGFCSDNAGGLLRQNGSVVRIAEFTDNPNQWIPDLDNKWIFALGFIASVLSIRGIFRG